MRPAEGPARACEAFFGPEAKEHGQGAGRLTCKSVGADGLDDVDRRAAGRWEDVEERFLRVRCPSGAGLRLGPGDRFETLEVLPVGMLLTAPPVPDWGRAPGGSA